MPNFENPVSGNNPKENEGYLSQISNHSSEKIAVIANAIIDNKLPKAFDGRLKILELGTGGGESIETLKKTLENRHNVDVFGADISVGILRKINNEQGISSVACDAMNLPFKENSLSAINASAVFHEVSSYGSFGNINGSDAEKSYGREAVKQSFLEVQRVLLPEGILAYRDVFCPDRMFEEKTVVYNNKAWVNFAKWFYPEFLEADSRAFPQNSQPKIKEDGALMELTATKHLHRELQRHYLMLRDYLRTQLAGNIGLQVVNEEWIDKENGIKTHEFLAKGMLYQLLNQEKTHEGYGKYIMQSEEYDALFDKLIDYVLEQELAFGSQFSAELSGWKKREGKEIYTYGSISEMLNLACEVSVVAKDGYILLPKSVSDISTLSRNYYNHYLQEVISEPEFDGKQIIRFFKVSLKEAHEALDNAEWNSAIIDVSGIKKRIEGLL